MRKRHTAGTSSVAAGTQLGDTANSYPGSVEMKIRFDSSLAIAVLCLNSAAFAAGGGSMSTPSISVPESPEVQATNAYNQGVRSLNRATELETDAARQSDAGKKAKLEKKARDSYTGGLRKFERATELVPTLHQAWNYIGYANRKLGRYADALAAYDRALALAPGYAQAIEYRGHAYLGLDRIEDAKVAYLALFAGHRELAASLLTGMQQWVGARRSAPGALGNDAVETFAAWVSERSAIAGQTASLTRAGAAAAWQ
jgi:tetratricopeptide (TPR) repeat protein